MATPPLPRHADVRKLAAAAGRLSGGIALGELPRLRDGLARGDGIVRVDLAGGIDDEGYRFLAGHVVAELALQCQRCLGVVQHLVDAPVNLALVWREDEIPSLPSRFEGFVAGTAAADLYELVEEELLLALPLVARHPEGECSAGAVGETTGGADAPGMEESVGGAWE